jgi:hypothetical protein
MLNFEDSEQDQAEFYGVPKEPQPSIVTGQPIRFFPSKLRTWYIAQSFFSILGLTVLVCGLVRKACSHVYTSNADDPV